MSQIMQGDALMQYRKHPKRVSGKKKKAGKNDHKLVC